MNGQERILRERFAQAACQSCGAEHRPDDVLVLAQRGSRWLVLLTCHRCKRRGIFVASFPHPTSQAERLRALDALTLSDEDAFLDDVLRRWSTSSVRTPHISYTAPADQLPAASSSSDHQASPVTLADVANMRQFLDGFNGDFRGLFGADGSGLR